MQFCFVLLRVKDPTTCDIIRIYDALIRVN